jgi:hypothetical protein
VSVHQHHICFAVSLRSLSCHRFVRIAGYGEQTSFAHLRQQRSGAGERSPEKMSEPDLLIDCARTGFLLLFLPKFFHNRPQDDCCNRKKTAITTVIFWELFYSV